MDAFIQVKERDLNILFVAAMATVAMMSCWDFMQENRVWYWGIDWESKVFVFFMAKKGEQTEPGSKEIGKLITAENDAV